MILPQPRVPPQVRSCASSSSFAPTVQYIPPKPRNPTGVCNSFEFRFLSQVPQNTRTQRGPELHTPLGFLGVWGYSLKDLQQLRRVAEQDLAPPYGGGRPGEDNL